jgi:hypothetical protein
MQRANVIELERVVRDFEERRTLTLTRTASEMLYSMVDAITRDPHWTWRRELGDQAHALDDFQKVMIERLHARLMAMPAPMDTRAISTFDLLHNVSSIVDSLCPFKKIPA